MNNPFVRTVYKTDPRTGEVYMFTASEMREAIAMIHSARRCAREWQSTAERAHAVAVKLADRLGISAEGTS
jgi:hypothetical protein